MSFNSLGLVTATRFWGKSSDQLCKLKRFLDSAVQYSDYIIVAIRIEEDQAGTLEFVQNYAESMPSDASAAIIALPVSPWNMFTTALNACLFRAALLQVPYLTADGPRRLNSLPIYSLTENIIPNDSAQFILFQSTEILTSKKSVSRMISLLQLNDALVVGTALTKSHHFREGTDIPLNGLTSPWNTNAVWHIPSLAMTGFIAVSDGIAGPTGAAIEEVCVIALKQSLTRGRSKAILVELPQGEVIWDVKSLDDSQRQKLHEEKMRSKVTRAEAQINLLGIQSGIVDHVKLYD